jgi:hypothetical protein
MHVLNLVTMSSFGLICIASGLITLRLFVRHSQPVTQEDE